MSQSSFSITNLSRTLFRTAVNTALQALASNNSGASEPSETYAHMWWADTTSGWVKQRNAANSAWEKKFPIAKARVDVASAATLDLDANAVTSDYLRITGTTTVTAVTLTAGQRRIAVAGGAFQLTNSASLIVQGGANYTTTAGDLLLFLGESGGVVRVYVLQNNGTAYVALTGDQTIAGVKTFSSMPVLPTQSMVRLNTATGYGSTNNKIVRFANVVTNQGSDITYADSASLGGSFTINTSGVYAIVFSFAGASAAMAGGLSLNTSQPTTGITSITLADILNATSSGATNTAGTSQWTGYLPAGSVVRAHTDGAALVGSAYVNFTIVRVS